MQVRIAGIAVLGVLAVGPLGGCARPDATAERKIVELKDELARSRADHDRLEQRLASLEVGIAELKAPAASAAARRLEEPRTLEGRGTRGVEVSAEGDVDDPDDRPTVRSAGRRAGGSASAGGGASSSRDDGRESTGPLDPRAKRAYDAALVLVNQKKHDEALDALAGFLVRWPDHPYAENATYWRGKCFLAKGDLAQALGQFEGVVARPRSGAKVADALYEVAVVKQKLGDAAGARAARTKLMAEHAGSDAARKLGGSGGSAAGTTREGHGGA